MYAVVGCPECSSLWVVEGRPETSQCPTCGQTRKHEKRREFVTTDDPDHAREVRASMLAARQGHDDAFADLDSFAQLEERVADAGIDDETYLEESGVDADAVAGAADRLAEGEGGGGRSRREVVLEALRDLDAPDEEGVVEYARRRDVPPEYARRALEKLVRNGRASESGGEYRLL
jgi:DNA-directed RNA polymerase subunit M/transcription elongation factor TFIIS